MAKQPGQKLKLLYLLDILREQTDEEHGLGMKQIRMMLQKQMRLEKLPDRKSVYSDFEELEDYGIEVELDDNNEYHLLDREFQLPEIKLLIDSIQASQFLSEAKTRDLIKKLEKQCSHYQAATLHREVIIANRVKTMNNSVHYNVDAIHNAIAENKQISFQYFHHDIGKKKVYSNKGEKVFVSPWALIYTDDNYYLLAFHTQRQEFRHYRVDRMDKVEKAMYDREGQEAFAKVDMAEYTKYTFSMYHGDKQPVTMRFTIDMVDAVMDRFGRDVLMLKVDDRHFELTAVVSVSPQFFGWVFGLGNKVEIIRPDDVREQMKDVLKQTLSKYDDNKNGEG